MPTYQYQCAKCGHTFDLFQSMSDQPILTCPKDRCGQKKWGKGKVKRVIGAGAGLLFKGSGFYITDYRSSNYKESAKKDTAPAPAAPATGGDSKGAGSAAAATKPASTAPTKASSKKASAR